MNLLIFPEYPYPTNHVVVETVFERLLPQRGHTIHMIRPAHDSIKLETQSLPWGSGSLVTFPYQPPSGALRNVAKSFRCRRWLADAIKTLDHTPLDAVLVRNDLMTAWLAQAFARRRGIPFVFQVSSPDAEFKLRWAVQGSSFTHVYARLRGYQDLIARRQICRRADVVLAISAAMRRYMIETEHVSADRVFSFPMGFNEPPILSPARLAEMRASLNLPEGRTLVYSGVLDPVREPQWMLDVLSRVNATFPDVALLVLTGQSGTDPRRKQFEKDAAARGVHVKIVGPLSHGQVGEYLQCADVMLSPINPIFEYRISSPTKSIEALGVGLPVVGNSEIEEHAVILNQSGGGIAVPWDLEAFSEAVVYLLSNPDERKRIGALGRQWAREHRAYTRLTDYLDNILRAAHSLNTLGKLPHVPE